MRAGCRPAHAWFLKIVSVRTPVCVFACVCLLPRLLITGDVMWRDMDPMRLVKQVLQLLYGNCSRTISLMGVALELVRVVHTKPIRVS